MSNESINNLAAAEEQFGAAANRRQFLKVAGATVAGAVLPVGAASWAGPAAAQPSPGSNTP